jgi:Family of unknown function (DUF5681)
MPDFAIRATMRGHRGGMRMPADSQQKQGNRRANGQFAEGRSGNPAGRAPGTRNRATMLAEQLLDGASCELAKKAVEMALQGDAAALRLCIGRIIAPRRHRPSGFALPLLKSAADLAPALAAIAEAVAEGALSTGEAWEFSQLVDTFIRALEAGDIEARLRRLESLNELVA